MRALLCIILFAAAGCGSARRGEPIGRPVTIANVDVARGRAVFFRECHQCHPGGEAGLGPALNNKPAPGFLIKTQVRTGLGTMPSFGKDEVSSEELDDLVKYLFALRKAPQE